MPKKIAACIFMITSTLGATAHAKWVEKSVIVDVDTSNRADFEGNLGFSKLLLSTLNKIDLAATSKLIIDRLRIKVANYKWENDSNCTVHDPSALPLMRYEYAEVDFHFQLSDDEDGVTVSTAWQSPCTAGYEKSIELIQRSRKDK